MKTTLHAHQRMLERGFSGADILDALNYAEVIQKQGLTFNVVVRKNLPASMSKDRVKSLDNMVVITADGWIITCYRHKNALRNIKKKRFNLVRYGEALVEDVENQELFSEVKSA